MASLALGPRRCRALAALTSEFLQGLGGSGVDDDDEGMAVPSAHGFVVGTTMLSGQNDLLTVRYEEEDKTLTHVDTRAHPTGEIWEIAAHPKERLLVSCWASASDGRGLSIATDSDFVSHVPEGEGARMAVFDVKTGAQQLATAHDDGTVKIWNFSDGSSSPTVVTSIADDVGLKGTKDVAFDPNSSSVVVAATGGSYVRILDFREGTESVRIETTDRCLTVDVNPNRPYYILSSGENNAIQFWDIRKPSEIVHQLKDATGHQHWVTRARYNPFHDQLVVSSSTDGVVCLWRAASVSSAPLLDMDSDEDEEHHRSGEYKKQQRDALVKSFDDNQDSVYGLTWSAVNAWLYASLSYDGRVVIHTVPSGEKYKILL